MRGIRDLNIRAAGELPIISLDIFMRSDYYGHQAVVESPTPDGRSQVDGGKHCQLAGEGSELCCAKLIPE